MTNTNTYGLLAINANTLNACTNAEIATKASPGLSLPVDDTDFVGIPADDRLTIMGLLKAHNLCLNVLGYFPGIAPVSGCIRIATGSAMIFLGAAATKLDVVQGPEIALTGFTQVVRGALEAFVPCGWIVNACLDGVCTYFNTKTHAEGLKTKYYEHSHDASYPFRSDSPRETRKC